MTPGSTRRCSCGFTRAGSVRALNRSQARRCADASVTARAGSPSSMLSTTGLQPNVEYPCGAWRRVQNAVHDSPERQQVAPRNR